MSHPLSFSPRRRCVRSLVLCCVLAPAAHASGLPAADAQHATTLQGVKVDAVAGAVITDAASGTKTDTPLIETPQSISVIDAQELTVRAVQNLSDALNYTAGTTANATGTDTRYDWPYIRGFNAGSFGIYLDGLRFQPGTFSGRIEPYMLQGVEILKGPSSVLYGQNAPGGLINAVSKQPTATPLHELGVLLGNYATREVKADVGGPLDRAGRWLYRLTAVAHDNDTQVDHTYDKRVAINPALTWRPGEDTRLTLLANIQRDLINGMYPFLPAQGTVLYNPHGRLDTGLFTGDTDFDSYRRTQYGLGYQFEHRIDDTWTFRQNARAQHIESDWRQLYAGSIDADYRTIERIGFHNRERSNSYALDTQALGRFDGGALSHTVLLGIDVGYAPSWSHEVDGRGTPLDIYAPRYRNPPPVLDIAAVDGNQLLRQTGLYAQDQIKLGTHWVGLFGLRHDWASNRTDDHLSQTRSHQSDEKTTGRAGLVYLTDIGLAPYVSWSTSFLPNSGTDYRGAGFAPTTGRQLEGGFKYQPRGIDALLTVSAFNLHQANVLQGDPAHPGFSAPLGEVRSRGVEFEGVARLAAGLQLRAAYTYDQVETTRSSDPDQLGKPPTTVPAHTASLWADYTVQDGTVRGLGIGLGVRRTGETYGGVYHPDLSAGATSDFVVPAFTLLDATVHYEWQGVRFALNLTNLADRHYVAACYGETVCSWGARRSILGSATYRW